MYLYIYIYDKHIILYTVLDGNDAIACGGRGLVTLNISETSCSWGFSHTLRLFEF